jgi:integrase/recombinase XerD
MKSADRFFSESEMSELLRELRAKARRGKLADRVDLALVVFGWATGCRASEIASMSMDRREPNSLDLTTGLVRITEAKWNSIGTIPLDVVSLRILRHYSREVRPRLRNADVLRQLFITRTGRPYDSNKMTKKLALLFYRYGYRGKTAHSLRHRFCTDLLTRGVALHEAKALMRHRDVRSTMVYSHATVDDLRAAVNRRIS